MKLRLYINLLSHFSELIIICMHEMEIKVPEASSFSRSWINYSRLHKRVSDWNLLAFRHVRRFKLSGQIRKTSSFVAGTNATEASFRCFPANIHNNETRMKMNLNLAKPTKKNQLEFATLSLTFSRLQRARSNSNFRHQNFPRGYLRRPSFLLNSRAAQWHSRIIDTIKYILDRYLSFSPLFCSQ